MGILMERSHLFVMLMLWQIGIILGYRFEGMFPNLAKANTLTLFELKPLFGLSPSIMGFFINNLAVGIVISISGLLSAGSLSCIISFWNAYMMGFLLKVAIILEFSFNTIFHKVFWHGVFEITGLIVFGTIGLKGFSFMQAFFFNKPFEISSEKMLVNVVFATVVLFIAAVIENMII